MSASPLLVLAYAAIPVAAAIVGSAVAAVRAPSAPLRSGVQHFAAGVVFAAVAGELLPEVLRIHEPVQVVIGFAVGVGLMLLVRHVTEPSTAAAESTSGSRSLLIAVGIDLAIDGLLVGIGFAAGAKTGVLLVIALTLEVLFLGVSTASALGASGRLSPRRIIAINGGLAALLAVGAGVGAVLLDGISDRWLEVVLGFGAAALLYLVTEELLTEAHEVPETPVATALFFVGFLALLIIEMVA